MKLNRYKSYLEFYFANFYSRSILWNKTPLRVVFFVWSAALGTIIALDNLRSGMSLTPRDWLKW